MKFFEELRQKQKDDIFGLAKTKKLSALSKQKKVTYGKLSGRNDQNKKLRVPDLSNPYFFLFSVTLVSNGINVEER